MLRINRMVKRRVAGAVASVVLTLGSWAWGVGELVSGGEEAVAAGGMDLSVQGVKVERRWSELGEGEAVERARELLRDQEVLVPYFVKKYKVSEGDVRRIVESAQVAGFVHGIDYKLILGMIEQESSFREGVGNWYGAVGLMQVVPRFHAKTIAEVSGVVDKGRHVLVLKNGEVNVRVGAAVLSEFADRSRNQLRKTLARYSGGARNYVEKVNRFRSGMERELARGRVPEKVERGSEGLEGAHVGDVVAVR